MVVLFPVKYLQNEVLLKKEAGGRRKPSACSNSVAVFKQCYWHLSPALHIIVLVKMNVGSSQTSLLF